MKDDIKMITELRDSCDHYECLDVYDSGGLKIREEAYYADSSVKKVLEVDSVRERHSMVCPGSTSKKLTEIKVKMLEDVKADREARARPQVPKKKLEDKKLSEMELWEKAAFWEIFYDYKPEE